MLQLGHAGGCLYGPVHLRPEDPLDSAPRFGGLDGADRANQPPGARIEDSRFGMQVDLSGYFLAGNPTFRSLSRRIVGGSPRWEPVEVWVRRYDRRRLDSCIPRGRGRSLVRRQPVGPPTWPDRPGIGAATRRGGVLSDGAEKQPPGPLAGHGPPPLPATGMIPRNILGTISGKLLPTRSLLCGRTTLGASHQARWFFHCGVLDAGLPASTYDEARCGVPVPSAILLF